MLHQAFAHCAIFPTAASRRSLDRVSVPMWPFTLSGRLLIVALVGRYPTNYLIRREAISEHIKLWYPEDAFQAHYAVLAVVSNCCPPLKGRFLTRYSPVRHCPLFPLDESSFHRFSFDLHVLSTPPAFVLSQDQTLHEIYDLIEPFLAPKSRCKRNC